nr:PadR family transcriptional regulator [Carnobacterium maltaromaticum]
MNSLGYTLLSMLVRKPCSGYELKGYLELFWQAHHSQIYPLLTKLEASGYVVYISENDPVHKKIYSITDEGKAFLQEWIKGKTAKPITRDEFLGKLYAVSIIDSNRVKELFEERKSYFQKLAEIHKKTLTEIEIQFGPDLDGEGWESSFGRYLICKRRYDMDLSELEWCEWAEKLYEKKFK